MSDLRATVDDVMKWELGPRYTRERVEEMWAGRESLTALEILDLDIPAVDRLRCALRKVLVPARILHEFACRCAERALQEGRKLALVDPRSLAAIAAKRDWLAREIGNAELRAASNAAYAARKRWSTWAEAAWAATYWDAELAAWEAARAAMGSYEKDDERTAQLEILRKLLKEEEVEWWML